MDRDRRELLKAFGAIPLVATAVPLAATAPPSRPASLCEFVAGGWHVNDDRPFERTRTVEAMCEHIEALAAGQIRNLLITYPRRSGATSVASLMFAPWVWTTKPSTRFLCATYSYTLACMRAQEHERLVRSLWYRGQMPPEFETSPKPMLRPNYTNNLGGARYSVSVGGAVVGIGGDILVIDDPIGPHVDDADHCLRVRQWYSAGWHHRVNNPATGRRLCVMGAGEEPYLARLLIHDYGYQHLEL